MSDIKIADIHGEHANGMNLELFHTSPTEIFSVKNDGTFGSFLCFSVRPYSMSACDVVTYKVNILEESIVEASVIFLRDFEDKLSHIVSEVMKRFSISDELAMDLLSEKKAVHALSNDADDSWWVQKKTAECARELGYVGCRMTDEQGSVYFIDAKKVKLKKIDQ